MKYLILVLWACLSITEPQALQAGQENFPDGSSLRLKDIAENDSGFLTNTGSDGFITLANVDRTREQLCGLELKLEFLQALERPALFEIFWRTRDSGYSERNKGFFIINQEDSKSTTRYLLPLCKMFHYSGNINNGQRQAPIHGLRIDYPGNKTVSIKFHSLAFLDARITSQLLAGGPSEMIILEPYERIEAKAFTSMDVALPKLLFALEQGLGRITRDLAFLIFWLSLMGGLVLVIVRSWLRQHYFRK
ncbi:MAG: hypothetical protein HKN85_04775 [Gammaproteobacteria bacterium]|nr:hypothetical protein [Gammaproteobacteria bacterium]